jgi:hypothetical protein
MPVLAFAAPPPQQNEVLRENQFTYWQPNASNLPFLIFGLIIFPVGFHELFKGEMELRYKRATGEEAPPGRYL